MNSTRKLWVGLAALLIASFAVLLWVGSEVHRQAPPMPEQVVADDGTVVYTRKDIETGRQVWQSIGGQQLGSIWGHGGYVAPDWGADWLHREAEAILDLWAAREHGVDSHLGVAQRRARVRRHPHAGDDGGKQRRQDDLRQHDREVDALEAGGDQNRADQAAEQGVR